MGTSRLGSGSTVLGASNSTGYCAFPSPNVGTSTTLDQQSGATGTSDACMESSNLITDQLELFPSRWFERALIANDLLLDLRGLEWQEL